MRFLITAVLLAIMQAAPPVPGKTPDGRAEAGASGQNHAQTQQTESAQHPSPTQIIASPANHDQRNDNGYGNTGQSVSISKLPAVSVERDLADWIGWGFNILLVVVGIFTLVAIWYQAREMKRATEVIKQQAELMKSQLTVTINTERAWIIVEIGELPDFQPNPNQLEYLWIRPAIRNRGNTTARIKKIRAVVRLVPDGETLPTIPEYPQGQGVDIQLDVMLPPDIPIQPIKLVVTGQEFIQVKEGKLFLYVHGFIDYMDLGEIERHTAFCYFYAIQRGFSPDATRFYLEMTAPAAYNQYK